MPSLEPWPDTLQRMVSTARDWAFVYEHEYRRANTSVKRNVPITIRERYGANWTLTTALNDKQGVTHDGPAYTWPAGQDGDWAPKAFWDALDDAIRTCCL